MSIELGGSICDFCGEEGSLVWFYPVKTLAPIHGVMGLVDLGTGEVSSVKDVSISDSWAACADCGALVNTQDTQLLAERAAGAQGRRFNRPAYVFEPALRTLYIRLFQDLDWTNVARL